MRRPEACARGQSPRLGCGGWEKQNCPDDSKQQLMITNAGTDRMEPLFCFYINLESDFDLRETCEKQINQFDHINLVI